MLNGSGKGIGGLVLKPGAGAYLISFDSYIC
jgi:hypothetical protein